MSRILLVEDDVPFRTMLTQMLRLEGHEVASAADGLEALQLVEGLAPELRKLEAVGTMAAGIAHEFNNILGSIVGYAELAQDELPEDSEARRSVGKVISGSFRARDLVSRILAFARQDLHPPLVVDLVAEIHEALDLGARGICLSVRDTGEGMSPAVVERMFDPFSTTKAPGEGTGLGMSVVYGIVTGLGGEIRVHSEVGGPRSGTEIRVFLPGAELG